MEAILKQILEKLNSMDEDIKELKNTQKKVADGQEALTAGMNKQFEEIKNDLRILKEQTVRASELQSPVTDVQKQVDDLAIDVKLIKRVITNQ
ncbi:hypothetical protein [Aneurinibacillus aneurinilyticus]|uniref:Uncharacterized protein n=1 Tax=Aneurinibacillus aneurinilyticus ATCC 12856 TaxID=649747 RepID=U1Y4J4_ANEAE|nr:hypothetical protein [Aneurinibacillus aneurinilyticus]ERI07102.1 hypothetical protein HMPREF0083_04807 [Aneurinibacillus aneurinilyticus ATCC 12856]MED0706441.1 hypothetical protein [Aneurinibacillus aneurinilyticus]MED0723715.1 hypothetical protein [Aneurinibacillus aneurinilyticus]MED0730604.1 hypothetical protein [Aneurinibacillus aneurinilyticus]MED0741067.1 hypothetical protein [Aneurinibacillus aneurinilyticus]